jgi:hypothetical protein
VQKIWGAIGGGFGYRRSRTLSKQDGIVSNCRLSHSTVIGPNRLAEPQYASRPQLAA